MQVGPDKISRMRAQVVGVAALTGFAIALGVQRRHAQEPQLEKIDRDISRTTRITPDGERINGSWVAVNFVDQELVDLAQSVHGVLAEKRQLPRIARHLFGQRCLDLAVALEKRGGENGGLAPRPTLLLSAELSSLRTSLLANTPDSEPRAVPLKDSEREALAKLIESAIFPLCVSDQKKLRELFMTSDKNLSKPRF